MFMTYLTICELKPFSSREEVEKGKHVGVLVCGQKKVFAKRDV
jgi:hypothetical protein